jgi:hypothetical protein
MLERLAVEKEDSDSSYFFGLMYTSEMMFKLVVAGLVSGIRDDRDRHRYREAYSLVRADSLGQWADVLDDVLTSSAAQFLDPQARESQRQLSQNSGSDTWQSRLCSEIHGALGKVGLPGDPNLGRVQARRWFRDFVRFRNATRGHGAPPVEVLSDTCANLANGLELLSENLELFTKPWAYLKRNLSGKYRVTPWGITSEILESMKSNREHSVPDGVYIQFSELRPAELIISDADATDFWFPNGNFTEKDHEYISYVTDDKLRVNSEPYLTPAEQLPPSHTEGIGQLSITGKCFSNIPSAPSGYVRREQLEAQLYKMLLASERYPLISLTGIGGIGKTSLTLEVIHRISDQENPPYNVILWFSARDVDLLSTGPKTVRPQGISTRDFANEYTRLIEPGERFETGFNAVQFLANELNTSKLGPILFVFDNFETTVNPLELFSWLGSFVRPPNKILITSRERRFTGDYAVPVGGMTDSEVRQLIESSSRSLGIQELLKDDYVEELIKESDGHPYIIKLLLGELAKAGTARNVERIIATQEAALAALFERSYAVLSPGAKRVFLTLCNWRSSVPEVALSAVLLRPGTERFDVSEALNELLQISFVEEAEYDEGGEREISVPLAARLFGKRKLETSPLRTSVQANSSMLLLFGPARDSASSSTVNGRIERLFASVADMLERDHQSLDEVFPILQFVATKHPFAWVWLADLLQEIKHDLANEKVKSCLYYYLEQSEPELAQVIEVWKRISDVERASGNLIGELNALAQICAQADVAKEDISNAANQINSLLKEGKDNGTLILGQDEKYLLLMEVATAFEKEKERLDGTDCSRLAWLYIHLDDPDKALIVAKLGLEVEPRNNHCQRLVSRLNGYLGLPNKTFTTF